MGAPLPQPWTGHRAVVPVEASFIDAIRRGAVVEFSTAPAADAPRMRGQLVASQVGPEFYWNQFDAQGRNTGTREVRADEVEGLVHSLSDPVLVPVAWMDSVEGEIERLIAAIDATSGLDRISMASEALMLADGSSRVHVARHYFRSVLQDSTVHTAVGPVQIVGGTWREMKRGMANDGIKAALVPMVPKILSDGRVDGGRQPDTKGRNDYVAFYFIRLDGIMVGDKTVDAGVGVGERPEGLLEYRLNAYSLGHSEMPAWQKRIAGGLPFGYEPKAPPAMGDGEPFLDDIMGYQPDDCNIVILAVRDAAGDAVVLDSASPMDRARIAADVARNVGELQGATGMQRVRIAGELAAMVGGTMASMKEKPKHSPEQLAKWAQEKCAREQAQASGAEAQRQEEKRRSAAQAESIRKSHFWSEFTESERSDILFYTDRQDRMEEGRRAAVAAIGRALEATGEKIAKASESQDGKSLSLYVETDGGLVRVSDHELPMTARRQNDRERGLSGRWDREVIVTDWIGASVDDYVAEVLGAADAQRLGYEALSDGAQQAQDQGTGSD